MIVDTVSTSQGGATAPLAARNLVTPSGDPPARVYRSVMHVRLPTGGAAERIVDAGGAVLRAAFKPYVYDAVGTADDSLRASRQARDGGVLVALDAPRRVVGIRLSPARAGRGDTLELYRLDGDTPATEPTVSSEPRGVILLVDEDATIPGTGFGGGEVMAFAMSGGAGGGPVGGAETRASGASASVGGRAAVGATFEVDFTDQRFLLRLRNSSGEPVSLGTADVTAITVRSYPRNPRIALVVPEDPGAPGDLDLGAGGRIWQAAGEIGNGAPHSAGWADAGPGLAAELFRLVDRFGDLLSDAAPPGAPAPLPADVDVALVAESDAPCVFAPDPATGGSAFRLGYDLVRESFPDGSEKRSLRFEPGRRSVQRLDIEVPKGAVLHSATVPIQASTRGDGSAVMTAADAAASSDTGVRLDARRWAAQRVQVADARSAAGVALALVTLTGDCEVSLELREDAGGSPTAGRILATGSIRLGRAGMRGWAVHRFADPVVVSTAPHWLIVGTTAGAVLWVTVPATGMIRMLERDAVSSLAQWGAIENAAAAYAFLGRGQGAGGLAGVTASLDGSPVDLVVTGDGSATLDLSAAASAYLAAHPDATTLPVTVEAVGPAFVTVLPARVIYGL